jgi:hypothetical protein
MNVELAHQHDRPKGLETGMRELSSGASRQ